MDVILDIEGGNSIPIEISPMQSVRQIKERVQDSLHIPFSRQNLFFNGQLLQDCVSIWASQIKHGSRIKLVVSTDAAADLPPPPPLVPDYEYSYAMSPEFPIDEYIPFAMQYHYDSFGMPKFSPDTQLRPMPPHLSMLGYTDHGSSTKLDIATDAATNLPPPLMQEPPPPPQQPPLMQEPPPPPPQRVTLNVKIPKLRHRIPIEMDLEDTFVKLKEKILALEHMKSVPMDRIVLRSHLWLVEYLDDQTLKDCALTLNHEINVFFKTFLLLSSRSRTPGKLMVNVIPMSTDIVSVLRNELVKLHQKLKFRLPEDGSYFFVHRQRVMFEEKSFLCHQVRDGDVIETFDVHESDL